MRTRGSSPLPRDGATRTPGGGMADQRSCRRRRWPSGSTRGSRRRLPIPDAPSSTPGGHGVLDRGADRRRSARGIASRTGVSRPVARTTASDPGSRRWRASTARRPSPRTADRSAVARTWRSVAGDHRRCRHRRGRRLQVASVRSIRLGERRLPSTPAQRQRCCGLVRARAHHDRRHVQRDAMGPRPIGDAPARAPPEARRRRAPDPRRHAAQEPGRA